MQEPTNCWKCGLRGHMRSNCTTTVSPWRWAENRRMAKGGYDSFRPRERILVPVSAKEFRIIILENFLNYAVDKYRTFLQVVQFIDQNKATAEDSEEYYQRQKLANVRIRAERNRSSIS